jgi:hypothetical protein
MFSQHNHNPAHRKAASSCDSQGQRHTVCAGGLNFSSPSSRWFGSYVHYSGVIVCVLVFVALEYDSCGFWNAAAVDEGEVDAQGIQ